MTDFEPQAVFGSSHRTCLSPLFTDRTMEAPSDVTIDKNDMIYAADSQSTPSNNPGFKQGIRIGSAKDGKVTAFIPEPSVEAGAPEGVGVDDAGNVYAGWTAKMAVRRYMKQ
jgi:hypothetical protein